MPRNEPVCKVCNKYNTLITDPGSSIICTNCGAEFSDEVWSDIEDRVKD